MSSEQPRIVPIAVATLLYATTLGWLTAPSAAQEYVVGAEDVLQVTVWGRPELTGRFTVDSEGTVQLPIIERVPVGGLTARAIEEALKTRLAAGYLKNPQVSVEIAEYRSQRVSVQGEVKQPGTVTLSGDNTLIDVLSRVGSVTVEAGDEILVIRQAANAARTLKDEEGSAASRSNGATQVVRVDLIQLQNGDATQNITLQDGDTVVVPRGEKVYVTGQVRAPGAYTIHKSTTILQALALAGGVTEQGAAGRTRVLRRVNGKEQKVDVKLDDIVQPGDTIVVPTRFF
jgi:polysaccharide export outer membrane protein